MHERLASPPSGLGETIPAEIATNFLIVQIYMPLSPKLAYVLRTKMPRLRQLAFKISSII